MGDGALPLERSARGFSDHDGHGNGFLVSFQIFALTLLGSLPLGMLVAFARMSRFKPLALLARFYISIMRGTPLMLQMFAIYFMPYYVFGINLTTDSKWQATIVAFIVNYAAYFAEIYRSRIQSIPRGQYEAAAEVLGYFRCADLLPHRAAAGGQAHPAVHHQRGHHSGQGHLACVLHWRHRDVQCGQAAGCLSGQHDALHWWAAFYWVFNLLIDMLAGRLERRLDYYHD